jgi:hypothetical protein
MHVKIRYVVHRINRLGQEVFHWQRRGHKRTRLPDDPIERAAMAEQLNVAADKATPDSEVKMARKLISPNLKKQRGTYRPRDKFTFEITTPKSPPQQPDALLTKGGAQFWLDLVGRAAQVGATELDSITLALLCNQLADIATAAANGFAPPASAYAQAHRYLESLGLSGVKSRVFKGAVHPADQPPAQPNPYTKFIASAPPVKPPGK